MLFEKRTELIRLLCKFKWRRGYENPNLLSEDSGLSMNGNLARILTYLWLSLVIKCFTMKTKSLTLEHSRYVMKRVFLPCSVTLYRRGSVQPFARVRGWLHERVNISLTTNGLYVALCAPLPMP